MSSFFLVSYFASKVKLITFPDQSSKTTLLRFECYLSTEVAKKVWRSCTLPRHFTNCYSTRNKKPTQYKIYAVYYIIYFTFKTWTHKQYILHWCIQMMFTQTTEKMYIDVNTLSSDNKCWQGCSLQSCMKEIWWFIIYLLSMINNHTVK